MSQAKSQALPVGNSIDLKKAGQIGAEYMLAAYNIDPEKVYISGYSGGGLFAEDEEIMGWLFGEHF